jgi:flagellar assembly protein FliH
MQSSYRIIKDTVIEKSTVISPPILDKIYEKMAIKHEGKKEIDINDVYNALIKEAYEKKKEIIKNANDEAKKIIDRAISEGEELKKKLCEEGYQEGYKAGYQEGYQYGINEASEEGNKIKEQAEALKVEADQYLINCHEETRRYIKNSEKEIIKLAVDIAKQIVSTELTINPEAIYKIAEKLISKSIDKKQIILKVNPQDFNIIKNRKEELAMYVEDQSNIVIVADGSIKHGSIKAETPSGFIDADIDTQFNIILNSILGD